MRKKSIPIILGVLSIVVPYFSIYSVVFAGFGILLGIMGFVTVKELINNKKMMKIGKLINLIGIVCSSLWGLYFMTSPI